MFSLSGKHLADISTTVNNRVAGQGLISDEIRNKSLEKIKESGEDKRRVGRKEKRHPPTRILHPPLSPAFPSVNSLSGLGQNCFHLTSSHFLPLSISKHRVSRRDLESWLL